MRELPQIRRAAVVLAWIALCFELLLVWNYWGSASPRNPQYLLWKAGLYDMDPGLAWEIFYLDPRREDLVIGKTEKEIAAKLGPMPVASPTETYLKVCYPAWPFAGKEVRRLGPFIVVFDNKLAAELILVKGC